MNRWCFKAYGRPVLCVAVLLLLSGQGAGYAQTTDTLFDPGLAQELQRTLNTARQQESVRGVSAAVMMDGQGLWRGVSGLSTLSPVTSVTPQPCRPSSCVTLTSIASRMP